MKKFIKEYFAYFLILGVIIISVIINVMVINADTFKVSDNLTTTPTFSEVYIPSEASVETEAAFLAIASNVEIDNKLTIEEDKTLIVLSRNQQSQKISYIINLRLNELEQLANEQEQSCNYVNILLEDLEENQQNTFCEIEASSEAEVIIVSTELSNIPSQKIEEESYSQEDITVTETPVAIIESTYSEYESASYIWNYFRGVGWNKAVCAGILGNIMAEVGGQTLDIKYWLDTNGYYGMCMWSKYYSPRIINCTSLSSQCDYLYNDMKIQFDYCGAMFGYTYDQFLQIQSPEEAALAFAKIYERCGSASYSVRQSNARTAYNYFVG